MNLRIWRSGADADKSHVVALSVRTRVRSPLRGTIDHDGTSSFLASQTIWVPPISRMVINPFACGSVTARRKALRLALAFCRGNVLSIELGPDHLQIAGADHRAARKWVDVLAGVG